MSTANHPQTDGLAERNIGTLEEALRAFCTFGQVQDRFGLHLDWVNMLFMIEYAYNSSVHATTKKIPFEVDIGRVPNASLSHIARALNTPNLHLPTASHLRAIKSIQDHAQEAIRTAHDYAKERWDKSHRHSDVVPGDWVFLSTKHYRFAGSPEKLKPPFVGPFLVLENVGPNARRLELTPPFHRKHPVFPVSALKKDKSRTPDPRFATCQQVPTPHPHHALEGEKHSQEEIELILNERVRRGEDGKPLREYLVHWKGYNSDCDVGLQRLILKFQTYYATTETNGDLKLVISMIFRKSLWQKMLKLVILSTSNKKMKSTKLSLNVHAKEENQANLNTRSDGSIFISMTLLGNLSTIFSRNR